ncbi:MAG TPA: tetratricopeptide repeat protein, partial [Gemmatimonadales bacterium]|nr:tetratricopeptide repeat protein [Gemmatimonadales bacterium]
GHVPFQGSHAEAVSYAIRNETPAPLRSSRPGIPEEVEQLVFRALHKDPAVRYQSGRELARALRQARGLTVPVTEPIPVPIPALRPVDNTRVRRRIWVAAAAALVGSVGMVVGWELWPVDRVTVAIAPVVNETGDGLLQPYRLAMTHALERRLAESRFVRVVPHSQLVQILQRFLVEGVDVSGRDVLQAIGSATDAQAIVVPRLIYEDGTIRARAEFLRPTSLTESAEPYQTEPRSSVLVKETAAELVEVLAIGIEGRFRRLSLLGGFFRLPSARLRTLDAEKAFEEGIRAFEEFEYSTARTAFQTAMQEDPDRAIAVAWAGRVAQVLGDRDAAVKLGALALEKLESARSNTSAVDRLLVEAVAAESRGESDVARVRYQRLSRRFPDEPSWLLELAAFHARQGDTATAIDTYHQALAADGRLARAHLFLCRLYNSTGTNDAALAREHGEKAREAFEKLGDTGQQAQALLCLVDMLRLGDGTPRAEAKRAASEAVRIFEQLKWPFNLSRAYHYAAMATDDPAEAAALWEQALSGARQVGNGALEATVLVNLGTAYHGIGDLARALGYYRQSYKLNETRGDSRGAAYSMANAGALMVQSGSAPEEGKRDLETALHVLAGNDTNFEMFCRQNLGEYYRHRGQFEEARREVTRALDLADRYKLDDGRPLVLLERARLDTARGRYASAREDLLQALKAETNPGLRAEMHIELGLVQTMVGDFTTARKTFGEAEGQISAGPLRFLEPRLMAALGVLAYESGQWKEALTEFRRLARSKPGALRDSAIVETRAYAALIDARNGLSADGRAAAADCVKRAHQMQRVLVESRCRVALARISLDDGRVEEADRALAGTRIEELGPELAAQVHYWRARVSILKGDTAAGESGQREAQRVLTELRDSIPVTSRRTFVTRPDIHIVLQ